MARTTSDAVIAVMAPGLDYDTKRNPSLVPAIEAASAIVDDLAEYATEQGKTLSGSRLELIERWLAAHFHKVSDRPYRQKSTAGDQASFDGLTGKYLAATLYGQTAITLDSSGYLLAQVQAAETGGGQAVASLEWLGKTASEQIPVWDRQ